ncbi:MAG: hypothetical protein Q9226_006505 [Calogaya cf. arnoldii]
MTAFTDLSLEVRQQVYRLSLLTAKTIYPYPIHYEEIEGAIAYRNWPANEKIAAGLLRANKQIREETAGIIFGKNVWHLSGKKELPKASQKDWPEAIWTAHRDKFRHVEVTFHFGDLTLKARRKVARCTMPAEPPHGWTKPGYSTEKDLMITHCSGIERLQDTWCDRMPFIASLHLSSLTVDMKDCLCSTYCCLLGDFILASRRMFGNFDRRGKYSGEPDSAWDEKMKPEDRGLPKPTHFEDTRIDFKNMEDDDQYLKYRLHRMGLGCVDCPLREGRRDLKKCKMAANPDGDYPWDEDSS